MHNTYALKQQLWRERCCSHTCVYPWWGRSAQITHFCFPESKKYFLGLCSRGMKTSLKAPLTLVMVQMNKNPTSEHNISQQCAGWLKTWPGSIFPGKKQRTNYGTRESRTPLHIHNRKRHRFPRSLSPGDGGTTGISEGTLHCKIKGIPLMERVKTAKRESNWKKQGDRQAFSQWRASVLFQVQVCSLVDMCSPLTHGHERLQNRHSLYLISKQQNLFNY